MDPVFELVGAWWWVAPTAVALGATSYGALTMGRRRSRRLEVDAAKHEVVTAQTAIVVARADVRAAQARVLTARADAPSWAPAMVAAPDEWRALQRAKQAQRSAVLSLRAKRLAVNAARARMQAIPARDASALPLAQVMAQHDAVTARWLDYETDPALALAFPQMGDARHPTTAVFLLAQRETGRMRPASPSTRMSPAEFVRYRDAVLALEVAFADAETAALRAGASPGGGFR